jgi:regulatory protein
VNLVSLKTENSQADGPLIAEFSDSSSLVFSTEYLPEGFDPGSLEAGRELHPWEEEAFRHAAACYRAEKAALRLIARAEQNSMGLSAKLEHRGFAARVVKAVVSRLLDRNLLDDQRYAELWIRSRLSTRKRVSPRWLEISLGRKGIDRTSLRNALKNALDPETEYNLLENYIENTSLPGNGTGSLRSNLKHEGFSIELIERYFDHL